MKLPPLPPLPRASGIVTIGDRIDMAEAGFAIRVDLWGMVCDGRVSAYLRPEEAKIFAIELARLAARLSR